MEQKITTEDFPVIKEMIYTHTLQEIGDRFSVSRERIRQVLKKMGINAKDIHRKIEHPCSTPECPNIVVFEKAHPNPICTACRSYNRERRQDPSRKKRRRSFEMGICTECGKRPMRASGICMTCYVRHHYHANPAYRQKRLEYMKTYQRVKKA